MPTIPFLKAFEALKKTYKSMEIRAAILRFSRNWSNIITIVRFSYFERMELLEIRKTLEKGYQILDIGHFRIVSDVLDIEDLDRIRKTLEAGKLIISSSKFEFADPIYLDSLQCRFGGRTRKGASYSNTLGLSETNCLYCVHRIPDPERIFVIPESVDSEVCSLTYFESAVQVINQRLGTDYRSAEAVDLVFEMPMYSTIICCGFDGLKATAEIRSHSNFTPTLDISVSSRDRIKSGVSFDLGSIKPREMDEEFKIIRLEKEFLQVSRQDRILFKLKLKELGSTYLDQEGIDVESTLNRKRKLSNSLFSVLTQFCSEENLESDLLEPKSRRKTRKDPSEVFERAISWILALSGFNTIWLQDYEKLIDKDTRAELGSLDLIAYHPDVKAGSTHGDVYIIAECTTGSVEIQKIDGLIEVKRLLHERIFSDGNVTVVPVIFCSTLASTAKSQAEGHGVKLLNREDIRDLLMELKMGKNHVLLRGIGLF